MALSTVNAKELTDSLIGRGVTVTVRRNGALFTARHAGRLIEWRLDRPFGTFAKSIFVSLEGNPLSLKFCTTLRQALALFFDSAAIDAMADGEAL